MSIPLVQNNEKDSINTSIIAIKRNIERINMLLGLSNSEEIDTSKFATKEELQQAVTDLQPVDEVALNNMQSVSSNAVAEVTKTVIVGVETDRTFYYKIGRIVFIQVLKEALTGSSGASIYTIPEGFRPLFNDTRLILVNNSTDTPIGQCAVYTNGDVKAWKSGGGSFDGSDYIFYGSYIAQ